MKMHKDEIQLSLEQVEEMLRQQFPQWADLEIEKLHSYGTTNTIYRLGEKLSIRIPKRQGGEMQIEKEFKWLDTLRAKLPLHIPQPVAKGQPTNSCPYQWAIYEWLEGRPALEDEPLSPNTATLLAKFILDLRAISAPDNLHPGPHNSFRGEPLENRDNLTIEMLIKLEKMGEVTDLLLLIELWKEGLAHPPQAQDIGLLHGDLQRGNFLFTNGEISAVIDFGLMGYGDTAIDLLPAWSFFAARERAEFLTSLGATPAQQKRAKAWCISVAAVALEYYIHTNPYLSAIARFTLRGIEAEG